MKLSIITITYNNLRGLQRTVASVQRQTFADYEMLIIDGGSTDDTVPWLQQIGALTVTAKLNNASQLRYVSEPDKGIYDAQNKGIGLAQGEYLYFLNAGDELLGEDTLQRMLTDATADIVYGNELETFYAEDGKILKTNTVRGIKNPTMMDLYGSCMKHQASFIRHSLFDQYGVYDISLRMCADWEWFLRVIGFHNEVTLDYRNIDIARFEAGGYSYTHPEVARQETALIRNRYFPQRQQADLNFFIRYERLRDAENNFILRFCLRCIMWVVKHLRRKNPTIS